MNKLVLQFLLLATLAFVFGECRNSRHIDICDDDCLEKFMADLPNIFEDQYVLIRFNNTFNRLSRMLASTPKSSHILEKYKIPKKQAAFRMIATKIEYEGCDKTKGCSCRSTRPSCFQPVCPRVNTDGASCSGPPVCADRCKLVKHKYKDGHYDIEKDLSEQADGFKFKHRYAQVGDDILEQILSSLGKANLSEIANTIREILGDILHHDAPDYYRTVIDMVRRPNLSNLAENGQGSSSNHRNGVMAGIGIVKGAVDIINTLSRNIDKERELILCPCPADQCPLGMDMKKCEALCPNNLGCTLYHCVCPGVVKSPHGD